MHVLLFTHIFPYPLNEGGKVAQFVALQQLALHHRVTLVSIDSPTSQKEAAALAKVLPSVSIQLLGATESVATQKPTLWQKYLGIAHWELTKYLQKGYAKDGILDNPFFIQPVKPRSEYFFLQWQQLLITLQPDCIQVDFVDNADIALMTPPSIPTLLVLHDLRYASVAQAATKANKQHAYTDYLQRVVKDSELAYLANFSALITFSAQDAARLNKLSVPVYQVPFAIPQERFIPIKPSKSKAIRSLLFIGPDHHYPNYDAVAWYATALAETVYRQFGIVLQVVGKWSQANQQQFGQYPGIQFKGFVDDLTSISQNAALLVPLRVGSGIRTKIMEAFAMGIPVITTSIGGEGIDAQNGKEWLIGNTPEELFDAITHILTTNIAETLVAQAQEYALQHFTPEVVGEKREKILQYLVSKK
jgi:glycosyltransferase involved in cell wall biosynthesis